MTSREQREKYPIGTKIRFIANEKSCLSAKRDGGEIGEVVKHMANLIGIHLPGSSNNFGRGAKEITWFTAAKNLQILSQKNKQLLFSFMGQEDG